jgi:myo-inositol-1(or 4)-monophosphatase
VGAAQARRVRVSERRYEESRDAGSAAGEESRLGAQDGELLSLAADTARVAGALLLARFEGGLERALQTKSSPTDLVSEADLASERLIRERLGKARPDDGFLGEEGGGEEGSSGLTWVVDPLDGTVNFLFGIPQWCVSIAVRDARAGESADGEDPGDPTRDRGRTLAGVIFDPCRDEMWAAARSGAATLNGARLERSAREELSTAMVSTGFYYDAAVRAEQALVMERLLPRVRDIRRLGSAALDLVWTAAGRYDAYFERGVKLWDVAAGMLICERAGLAVAELPSRERLPAGVLAAAPALVDELLELVH